MSLTSLSVRNCSLFVRRPATRFMSIRSTTSSLFRNDIDDNIIPPLRPVDLDTILYGLANASNSSVNSDSDNSSCTNFCMPAEWAPHSACLILFPHNVHTFRLEETQNEILYLAEQIVQQGNEDVYLLCNNTESVELVRRRLNERIIEYHDLKQPTIHVHECPSDDTWARDTGPTFVFLQQQQRQQTSSAQKKLIGLDWNFNAYGGPVEGCYWPCTKDQNVARIICQSPSIASTLHIHSSLSVPITLEGGSFHTDVEGTLLTTQECLLHPNRNPHLSQQDIEQVLQNALGVQKILWLPTGLDADDDTNGQVDNFCCFGQPGHVVLAWTDDMEDDNYYKCRQAQLYLQNQQDAKGRRLQITKLYLPSPPLRYTQEEAMSLAIRERTGEESQYIMVRHPHDKMAASYVNFYIANQAVLVPQFGGTAQDTDAQALVTLRHVFQTSHRAVIGIPSREILLGGGNIHCQTQQVPLTFVNQSLD
jgi:agmatine deiminase